MYVAQNMDEILLYEILNLRNIHLKKLNIIIVEDWDDMNNPRLPTTTYKGNVVLTCRPRGEESVHISCP